MEQIFDFDKVQKSGAVFGEDKLNWFNREYIKRLTPDEFLKFAWPYIASSLPDTMETFEILKKIEPLIRDRVEKFSDVGALFEAGEFDYFFKDPVVDDKMLAWKDSTLEKAHEYLKEIKSRLEKVEDWNYESIKGAVWDLAETNGRGDVLWPMRVALSGREKSPDPFELASILGKPETIKRLSK